MRAYLVLGLVLFVGGSLRVGAVAANDPPATAPAEGGHARLIKVLTPLDSVGEIVPDGDHIWFGSWGGVKVLDRSTGQLRFFTRHDGLATNSAMEVSVLDKRVYAFHGLTNQVSILEPGSDKWTVGLLGEKLQRGFWSTPWKCRQARSDGIWCLFTGLPDSEFGPPSVIEVQQYDLKTRRPLKSVDVLKSLPPSSQPDERLFEHWPAGLVFLAGDPWVATANFLIRADWKGGQTEGSQVVALPKESAWDHIYDGHQAKQQFPNRIYSIAAGDKCLWLGLEAGLAKYDPVAGKFTFLFVRDEKP